jgi:hypothetical protein
VGKAVVFASVLTRFFSVTLECKKALFARLRHRTRVLCAVSSALPVAESGGDPCRHARRRRKPKLSFPGLLMLLVYHVFVGNGALETHVDELTGILLSASALSQRRQRLPWQVFRDILAECLACRANPREHSAAFHKGLRLRGLDGTGFGVNNVPRLVCSLGKAVVSSKQPLRGCARS